MATKTTETTETTTIGQQVDNTTAKAKTLLGSMAKIGDRPVTARDVAVAVVATIVGVAIAS